MTWLQIFWTGNLALVVPSLVLSFTGHSVSDESAAHSSVGETASTLRFWQFRKRIHHYYLFGLVLSGWIGYNAFWAYYSGAEVSERLQHLCEWALSPKQVKTDAASTLLASEFLVLHLLQRLYVSSRVSIFSRREALNLVDIALSLAFYGGAALTVVAEAPDFALVPDLSLSDLHHWYHAAGVAVFVVGSALHYKAHAGLAKLRRNKAGHIVSTGYKIPRGGMFEYVSCPHYLAEILIYSSLGMMLGLRSHTWWLLTAYVATAQVRLAYNTHMWYKNKFADYPKERAMLAPFVF